ncbi:MAG TPA: 2-octaprenyl-6-methoxyphenyl hydroxylase, partial [Chromatiaceae bacterium]|nr:2-octaprenyl-6-methoxyphenyl hydroxylase [Chromatiaceae bacterium]
ERFTANGPLALLPMRNHRCALVWTVADNLLEEVLSLQDEAFLQRIQSHFGWRLGRFRKVGRRQGYPLSQLWVRESVKPRVAIIGNAAHSLHPVAGQGFNLGIRDVAALAEVVIEASRQGLDPGSQVVLERYANWRRRDQRQVIWITDSLVRIFSNRLPVLRLGRNLGLLGVELCPPLRHRIARSAMGIEGRLPRLARGVPL